VTNAEGFDKLEQKLMVRSILILKLFENGLVFEVDVGNSGFILLFLGVVFTIGELACRKALELHDVLGKGACFVREDVVNHAQLLVQVRRLHLGFHALLDVKDHPIVRNEHSLEEFDHFKSDEQRDRHEVHEGQEPGAKRYKDLVVNRDEFRGTLRRKLKVGELLALKFLPEGVEEGSSQAESTLDEDGHNDVRVGDDFDFGLLGTSACRVLHDFGLVASKDSDSSNPLSVAQAGSSHQNLVDIKRNNSAVLHGQVSLELVKELVGRFALNDSSIEVGQSVVFILGKSEYTLIRLLVLEVCLTVQVFGFDVADTLRDGGVEKEKVAWEHLVFFDLNDLANKNVLTPNSLESVFSSGA